MRTNKTKQKLDAGQVAVGTFSLSSSHHAVGALAAAGFDFVMLDMEHTELTHETLALLVRTADACDVTPLVRAQDGSRAAILKTLEAGAQGVMVPMVNTPEQAREIVNWAKYQPVGKRGLFWSSYNSQYAKMPFLDHLKSCNDNTLVIVQIETAQALENVEAIAATPGVDVLLIGPADLSGELGVPGEFTHPQVQAAVERILSACKHAGKPSATASRNQAYLKHCLAHGCRMVVWDQDMLMLRRAAEQEIQMVKGLLPA
jgi:4-hydroxy-2-oxoheptanedioate aldolase